MPAWTPCAMLHAYNIHIMHVMYWRNVDGLIRYAREFSIARLPLKNQRSRLRLGPDVRMLLLFLNELSNQHDKRILARKSRSIVPKSSPFDRIQMKEVSDFLISRVVKQNADFYRGIFLYREKK